MAVRAVVRGGGDNRRRNKPSANGRTSRFATHARSYRGIYGLTQPLEEREVYGKEIVRNAMQKDAAEFKGRAGQSLQLDFHRFCELVRKREPGGHSGTELRRRFDEAMERVLTEFAIEERQRTCTW